jgi:hypothetical protein
MVGFIWTKKLVAKASTDTGQHNMHINTKANIRTPSRIRTRDPSNQAAKTYDFNRTAAGIGL